MSAQLESDLAELGDAERAEYLEGLGVGAAACPLSHTLLPTMVLELLGTTLTLTQTLSPLTLTQTLTPTLTLTLTLTLPPRCLSCSA